MSDSMLISTRNGLFTAARGKSGWAVSDDAFLGDNVTLALHDPRSGMEASTLLPGDLWLVELRTPAGLSSTAWPQDASVTRVLLDGGATLQVLARLAV